MTNCQLIFGSGKKKVESDYADSRIAKVDLAAEKNRSQTYRAEIIGLKKENTRLREEIAKLRLKYEPIEDYYE